MKFTLATITLSACVFLEAVSAAITVRNTRAYSIWASVALANTGDSATYVEIPPNQSLQWTRQNPGSTVFVVSSLNTGTKLDSYFVAAGGTLTL
ncbi:hypothetical protein BGZ83_000689 [Gryganskiella cystojenkinii]|nr:hypothetical protein BGZ83_000689 [Gryganskiella cystojenkinii]